MIKKTAMASLMFATILSLPAQAYTDGGSIRAEYDALWSGVKDVDAGTSIKDYMDNSIPAEAESMVTVGGSDPGDPDYIPDETEHEIYTSGDYKYWIHDDRESVTISEYTNDKDDVSVYIPSEIDGYKVTEIGYQAFTYKKMKSVIIPAAVETIGQRAFEYCIITDKLEIPENIRFCGNSFSDAELPLALTFPAGAEIDDSAFSYCDTLEQVFAGPGSVIHSRAFGYCAKLEKAIIGEGSSLEKDSFEYCEKLTEVVFCGRVKADDEAFSYCGDITYTRLGEDEPIPAMQPEADPDDASAGDTPTGDVSAYIGSFLSGGQSGHTQTPDPTSLVSSDEYSITVTGDDSLIVDCPKTAKAGDIVSVSTMDIADGEVVLEVNGADTGKWEDFWTYTFTMPGEDVEIHAGVSTAGYPGA